MQRTFLWFALVAASCGGGSGAGDSALAQSEYPAAWSLDSVAITRDVRIVEVFLDPIRGYTTKEVYGPWYAVDSYVAAIDLETGEHAIHASSLVGEGDPPDSRLGFALDAEGNRAFLLNVVGDTFRVLDLETGTRALLADNATGDGPTVFEEAIITTLPEVVTWCRGLVYRPATDELLTVRSDATDGADHGVSLIAISAADGSRRVVAPLPLEVAYRNNSRYRGAAIAVDGEIAYVVRHNGVVAVNLTTGDAEIISSIDIGTGADFSDYRQTVDGMERYYDAIFLDVTDAEIDRAAARLLVVAGEDKSSRKPVLRTVDLATGNRAPAPIDGCDWCHFLALDPAGESAYATNLNLRVLRIDVATLQIVEEVGFLGELHERVISPEFRMEFDPLRRRVLIGWGPSE